MKRLLVAAASIAFAPLVLPAVASAGLGGCIGDYPADGRGESVHIKNMCFDPLVIRVAKGATVRWSNADASVHNIVGTGFKWGSEDLRPGDSVSFRFKKSGIYPFACTIHPLMIGAVVVGDGVRAAGEVVTPSAVKFVASTRSSAAPNPSARANPNPSASASSPTPDVVAESSSSGALGVPASNANAQPSAQPKVAQPVVPARARDRSGLVIAGLAVGTALALVAVALLARRPPARRELVG